MRLAAVPSFDRSTGERTTGPLVSGNMIDADQIPTNALQGLKILNLAVNVPGPWAAARLGMLGAEVTKVEPPAGDALETWCPSWYGEMAANATIECVDAKTAEGRERLNELLDGADVLITSVRPSALARMEMMVNPYFATVLTVFLGVMLGMNGLIKIWGRFCAATQLLAGIGLLAVAAWLGNAGKNNRMFLFPMSFMMVVTLCSLALIVRNQILIIMKGGADWGPYAQAIIGSFLIVLALELAVEGYRTIFKKKDPDQDGEAPAVD